MSLWDQEELDDELMGDAEFDSDDEEIIESDEEEDIMESALVGAVREVEETPVDLSTLDEYQMYQRTHKRGVAESAERQTKTRADWEFETQARASKQTGSDDLRGFIRSLISKDTLWLTEFESLFRATRRGEESSVFEEVERLKLHIQDVIPRWVHTNTELMVAAIVCGDQDPESWYKKNADPSKYTLFDLRRYVLLWKQYNKDE